MKYNIPANINENITLHKSVTAAGENNRQREIKIEIKVAYPEKS